MWPWQRPLSTLPPTSAGVVLISAMPRSSAASPRVIGPATSDRCLIGVTSISIAVTKATKPPTEPPVWPLCHIAATITADSAIAARICVTGVIVDAATTDLIVRRRSISLTTPKRPRLVRARVVQPHDAPGEHVLLDHVGQLVGGLLALHRQAVQPLAEHLHDPGDGREQDADEQRQLPVQVQQVGEQRDQASASPSPAPAAS
jgi:hypothetical protein